MYMLVILPIRLDALDKIQGENKWRLQRPHLLRSVRTLQRCRKYE
jgi:hypothetical protein